MVSTSQIYSFDCKLMPQGKETILGRESKFAFHYSYLFCTQHQPNHYQSAKPNTCGFALNVSCMSPGSQADRQANRYAHRLGKTYMMIPAELGYSLDDLPSSAKPRK